MRPGTDFSIRSFCQVVGLAFWKDEGGRPNSRKELLGFGATAVALLPFTDLVSHTALSPGSKTFESRWSRPAGRSFEQNDQRACCDTVIDRDNPSRAQY